MHVPCLESDFTSPAYCLLLHYIITPNYLDVLYLIVTNRQADKEYV